MGHLCLAQALPTASFLIADLDTLYKVGKKVLEGHYISSRSLQMLVTETYQIAGMKGRELCFHEAVMSTRHCLIVTIYLAPQYLIACDLPTSSHTAPRHNIRAEAYFLISPLWHVMDTMPHQTSYAHIFT